MKFKVGQKCKLRNGEEIEIISIDEKYEHPIVFRLSHGAIGSRQGAVKITEKERKRMKTIPYN